MTNVEVYSTSLYDLYKDFRVLIHVLTNIVNGLCYLATKEIMPIKKNA